MLNNPKLFKTQGVSFGIWLTLYCSIAYYSFIVIYNVQSKPFIDELFHIDQARFYCNGEFNQWNNKITTLPGLYIFTTIIYIILSIIGVMNECNVFGLRALNAFISVGNFLIIYSILQSRIKLKELKQYFIVWEAFNLSIFPVLYFFNFLYYTDTLSTFTVLIMFRLHLAKKFKCSSSFGLLSVIVRQTNIVWVGFFLLDALYQSYMHLIQSVRSKKKSVTLFDEFKFALNRFLSKNGFNVTCDHLFGYTLVCILFLAFMLINGGIVVGDRTAHQMTLHVCQLFYYALFFAIFSLPLLLMTIQPFVRCCTVNFYKILLISLIMCATIYYNTIAHPYLLADNRHYTFYAWKNLYQRNILMRYILVPLYIFSIYTMSNLLTKSYWHWCYWTSICLLLIPQKLLEFRYFTLPYIILRISSNKSLTRWQLAVESLTYCVFNALTIYIFVSKQFYWSDSTEIQRIIW